MDSEEDRIHGGSVAGKADISEQTTGTIEGGDGNSLSPDDISEIYMNVRWWDPDENEDVEERIVLYQN